MVNIVHKKEEKNPPLKLFVLFRRLYGPVQRLHRVRGERDHVSRLHPPPLHPKQQVGPQARTPRTFFCESGMIMDPILFTRDI